MATLDRWRTFLRTPMTIIFPKLQLCGRDFAPPIVTGSGEIRLPSLTRFEFTLKGMPDNIEYAFAEITRQQRNPYDDLARFRLCGCDSEGVEWSLGWTTPRIEPREDLWTFLGEIGQISPHDESDNVSKTSSTELIFPTPFDHPMAIAMRRFAQTKQNEDGIRHEHVVDLLGSTIRFAHEPADSIFSITASHSDTLSPTYTENWLGEPLRILFGQLIYPRLVARNLGNGRTHVFVRVSPGPVRSAGWAALWPGENLAHTKETFWTCYTDLLSLVAHARNRDGSPNFEANKITRFYEEIIQASHGTRWVWALTFASCIEGLANQLVTPGQPRRDSDEKATNSLVTHINRWCGDKRLKRSAVNAVHRSTLTTTIHTLRGLVSTHTITQEQFDAWQELRNSVMHGSLISPYSGEEEDRKLLALAAMMHALTRALLRRSAQTAPC